MSQAPICNAFFGACTVAFRDMWRHWKWRFLIFSKTCGGRIAISFSSLFIALLAITPLFSDIPAELISNILVILRDNPYESGGLLLSIVAVSLAYYHVRKLTHIAREISTHAVGTFPRHLSTISELVDTANASIDILADCTDYGSLFDPAAHDRVFEKILEAICKRNIKVRVLVAGAPQPITQNSQFYPPDREEYAFKIHCNRYTDYMRRDTAFLQWLEEVEKDNLLKDSVWIYTDRSIHITKKDFADNFGTCIKICQREKEVDLSKKENQTILSTILMIRQKYFDGRLRTIGVSVKSSTAIEAPVFFWLQDQELDAVFAFADSGNERGKGFRTHDSDLIRIFHSSFEQKWKLASEEEVSPEDQNSKASEGDNAEPQDVQ